MTEVEISLFASVVINFWLLSHVISESYHSTKSRHKYKELLEDYNKLNKRNYTAFNTEIELRTKIHFLTLELEKIKGQEDENK